MSTAPSKYAGNQIETATIGSFRLMSKVLDDCYNRLTVLEATKADFTPALAEVNSARIVWDYGMTAITNAEALQLSKTPAIEQKLASLTHKPDMDTNSPIESWDLIIRTVAPLGSSTYIYLLPHGRETLTKGTINQRINAIADFGGRLAEQTTQPTLTALASSDVTPFSTELNSLRTQQQQAKVNVEDLREEQEALRLAAAAAVYSAIGLGMTIFKATPERVDEIFDVDLLRGSNQDIPAAPIDTAWDAATRTLSTTEMPAGATHLVAYREGEGGAPELLAEGSTDEMAVGIPASYTFDPGESYDLWLVGKNSRGMSEAGPVVVWTAPL